MMERIDTSMGTEPDLSGVMIEFYLFSEGGGRG
jgi:hypothetical protein